MNRDRRRKKITVSLFLPLSLLTLGSLVRSPCYEIGGKEIIVKKEDSGDSLKLSGMENGISSSDDEQEFKTVRKVGEKRKLKDKEGEKSKKDVVIRSRSAGEQDISSLDKGKEYRVNVKGVIFDKVSRSPVVILVTEDENRFVPIWIGFAEATAIEISLRGINPPRPMTHDLIKNMIDTLGGKVAKVKITHIKNNTYYAFIKVVANGKTYYIDSRPSDAIAIALRTKTPIYISEKILKASITIPKEDIAWEKAGISIQQITPELEGYFKSKGVVISDVRKGSPAYGKLKRGDIIIEINGKKTTDEEGLKKVEAEISKSKKVRFTVIREGRKHTVEIDLE